MIRTPILALAAFALALPALAQDKPAPQTAPAPAPGPAPAPADKSPGDIIVNGTRDKNKEVQSFVRSLAPARDGRQIARWNGEICLKVLGLWPGRDKIILDHIAVVAKQIGARVKVPPKCDPNTLIMFTSNADKLAAIAVDEFPNLIVNVAVNGLPPKKEVARYTAPRPVRWFAINDTTLITGTSIGTVDETGTVNAVPSSVPASRMNQRTRENTVASLVIVDESKLNGIKWSQLADYLAMVTFAQPAIDADFTGTDSVMAIFAARDAGKPGPVGLTTQDSDFLLALYRTAANLSSSQQRGVIADSVRKGAKKKP